MPYADYKGEQEVMILNIIRLGLPAPFLLMTYELDTVHLHIMSLFVLVPEPKIKR